MIDFGIWAEVEEVNGDEDLVGLGKIYCLLWLFMIYK